MATTITWDGGSLVLDASTFGPQIESSVVASVLGRADLTEAGVWTGASSVLRQVDTGVWRFRHEAYRRAAYDTLTFARRRHLG